MEPELLKAKDIIDVELQEDVVDICDEFDSELDMFNSYTYSTALYILYYLPSLVVPS